MALDAEEQIVGPKVEHIHSGFCQLSGIDNGLHRLNLNRHPAIIIPPGGALLHESVEVDRTLLPDAQAVISTL